MEIDIPMRGELYRYKFQALVYEDEVFCKSSTLLFLDRFAAHRWLDKHEGDGKIELELTPSDVIKKAGGKYFNLIWTK